MVAPQETEVADPLPDVAVGQREAAGLVVGGDHHQRVAVLLGPVEHGMQHTLEVGQLGTQVGGVVVVACPVDLRPLNHHGEALGVAAEHLDGLHRRRTQHVAALGLRQRVAVVEQPHHTVAAESQQAVERAHHGVAAGGEGVKRAQPVLAVLRQEIPVAAANHHAVTALRQLQRQGVVHLAVGHMAVGRRRRGVHAVADNHEAGALAGVDGVVEDGAVARRVRRPVHVVVLHLLARGQRRAAGRRVGAVLVERIGTRKTAVRKAQEGAVVALLGHHRGIDLGHAHAVAHYKDDVARRFILLVAAARKKQHRRGKQIQKTFHNAINHFIIPILLSFFPPSNFNIIIHNINNQYDTTFSYQVDYCNVTKYNSEYLVCCKIANEIICDRRDSDFKIIKSFNLNVSGIISNLSLDPKILQT